MPAKNEAAHLETAVNSVLSQSLKSFEIIIVNDGSVDATSAIAHHLSRKDKRIRVIDNPKPVGAARARNSALQVASGRYIAFLDADDVWLPDKLGKQMELIQRTKAALCYSGFVRSHHSGRTRTVTVPTTVDYDTLLHGNVIGCLTAMIDTQKTGLVSFPTLKRRHDFALWLKIVEDNGPAVGVPEPLAIYYQRPGSLSSNVISATAATWNMYRTEIGLPIYQTAKCLSFHLLRRIRN